MQSLMTFVSVRRHSIFVKSDANVGIAEHHRHVTSPRACACVKLQRASSRARAIFHKRQATIFCQSRGCWRQSDTSVIPELFTFHSYVYHSHDRLTKRTYICFPRRRSIRRKRRAPERLEPRKTVAMETGTAGVAMATCDADWDDYSLRTNKSWNDGRSERRCINELSAAERDEGGTVPTPH